MINDPFLDNTRAYLRLLEEYNRHKSLVIAVDMDNTLFDYHSKGYKFPALIKLLQDCNKIGFKIVIFSGSAKERHPFIREYCEKIGVKISGINQDVIDWHKDKSLDWSSSKIYYNIFLDDRAGLASAYEVLRGLVDTIMSDKGLNDFYESF